MMFFRLNAKCGNHRQDGVTYVSGDTVESELDLEKLFCNKFTRAHDLEKDPPKGKTLSKPDIFSPPSKDGDDDNSPHPSNKKKKKRSVHGKRVSKQFPIAKQVAVVVYEKANWYTVVDKVDGVVLNDKKLRKKDVDEFLKQYLNDDDDDDDGIDEDE